MTPFHNNFLRFAPFRSQLPAPSGGLEVVNVHELLPPHADHHGTTFDRIIVQGETYHAEVAEVRHVEIACLGRGPVVSRVGKGSQLLLVLL